jgi:hypothetical protein
MVDLLSADFGHHVSVIFIVTSVDAQMTLQSSIKINGDLPYLSMVLGVEQE